MTPAGTITLAGSVTTGSADAGVTATTGGIIADATDGLIVSSTLATGAAGAASNPSAATSGGITLTTVDGDIQVDTAVATGTANGGTSATSGSVDAFAGIGPGRSHSWPSPR